MTRAREIVALYRSECELYTMVQPNAGLPVLVDGKTSTQTCWGAQVSSSLPKSTSTQP